jgi:hypothetical protein
MRQCDLKKFRSMTKLDAYRHAAGFSRLSTGRLVRLPIIDLCQIPL